MRNEKAEELFLNEEGRSKKEELPGNSSLLISHSSFSDHSSLLTPNSSLKAPGAFTAPRALASFDGKTGTVTQNAELSSHTQGMNTLPKGDSVASGQKSLDSSDQDSVEEVDPKQTETNAMPDQSDQLPETQNQVESKSEKETIRQNSEPETKKEEETPKPEEIKPERETNQQDSEPETKTEETPKPEEIKSEEKTETTDSNTESETEEETPNHPPREPEERSTDRTDTANPPPGPPDTTALSYPPPRPDIDPEDQLIYDDSLPGYLQILQNVFARSGSSKNCELIFTEEEICYLAKDPDFNEIYPRAAEEIRSILKRFDDG